MANDLATLRTKLATALSDPTYGYWTSAEMDDLVKDAIDNLWPRYAQRTHGRNNYALSNIATMSNLTVPDQSWYGIPVSIDEIDHIEMVDSAGAVIDEMPVGTWMAHFAEDGTSDRLQINPAYSNLAYRFRVQGLKRYNLTDALIPNEYIDLVISASRSEAYRRALGDRMRFKQWATTNQIQNVSVTEMLGMIQESERKADQQRSLNGRVWRRPVSARV